MTSIDLIFIFPLKGYMLTFLGALRKSKPQTYCFGISGFQKNVLQTNQCSYDNVACSLFSEMVLDYYSRKVFLTPFTNFVQLITAPVKVEKAYDSPFSQF